MWGQVVGVEALFPLCWPGPYPPCPWGPCRWGQRTHLQAWMEAMAPQPLLPSPGPGASVAGRQPLQSPSGCRVRGASGSSWAFQMRGGGSPGPPGSTHGGTVGSTIVGTHCRAGIAPPYPTSSDTGIATLGCTYR